jgi:hypothetical protein
VYLKPQRKHLLDWKLENSENEQGITLGEIAPRVRDSFVYIYDFGDTWEHLIRVEKISDTDSRFDKYPVCIGGERACPPEDCGGIGGYYESFLPAITNPRHKEHKDRLEWVGGHLTLMSLILT